MHVFANAKNIRYLLESGTIISVKRYEIMYWDHEAMSRGFSDNLENCRECLGHMATGRRAKQS